VSLQPSTRLGPYEIISAIGAGGMGEVYKARDTRLDRIVAIKVLPAEAADDPERRQRFEREARAVSSLSHPHICPLFDIGRQEGIDYLVMECLEGETLAARLAKGPMPVDQALRYAIEMADALAYAHGHGVVHRDLKPGNVMLAKAGAKLLDFGLAKKGAVVQGAADANSAMPTATGLTQKGAIIGTLQYMAPEQLEGKDTDARTDIFAFGAVLYEMVTGRKAFGGKSPVSLIAAIMDADPPPISTSQPLSPPALDHVVKKCLAKDPDGRWQSADDLKSELQWIVEGGSEAGVPAAVVPRRKNRERVAWAIAALAVVAASILAVLYFHQSSPEQAAIRLTVSPPEKVAFGDPFSISPDGRRLALLVTEDKRFSFSIQGSPRANSLWVRRLDSLDGQPLPGTEGADHPFWSPDSRYIAFFAQGKLRKIEASGGPSVTLCDAPDGRRGTWNRDGVIVFSPAFLGPLYRVSAEGGAATPITTLDPSREEDAHLFPQFLPDGRHFLYYAKSTQRRGNEQIYIDSLDSKLGSKNRKPLVSTHWMAAYTPAGGGYLLFIREGTLMAQRFNADRLELSGEPSPVAEKVAEPDPSATTPWNLFACFSASTNGVLAHWNRASANTQLAWFDRQGKQLGTVGAPGDSSPSLSPDGKRVAITRSVSSNTDIWLLDLARSTASRFTFDPAGELGPLWSPDGSRIVFNSNRDGKYNLYQKASSGVGNDELLLKSDEDEYPTDWSSDGRFIVFEKLNPKTNWGLWVLPLEGDRKPFPFLQTQFTEWYGEFSPDGQWMAYQSDESGRFEVYVQPFNPSPAGVAGGAPSAPGGKWQISTGGGAFPRWRRDGKELFYIALDRKLMAVEVKTGAAKGRPAFERGIPTALFDTGIPYTIVIPYAATADGRRFLINTAAGEQRAPSLTVVVNWTAGLKR
jgi:eukaryotic-like serine/threonine-protein kinase